MPVCGSESEKLKYLRVISDLWAAKGWNPHDKRIILEATNYLINLTDEDYARQMVNYIDNLKLKERDREMYVSIFERVYTARGIEKGREEGRGEGRKEIAKNLLSDGIAPEVVARNTGLSLDTVAEISGFSREKSRELMD